MYCIEGEVTTRRNPETLIGEFGTFYTDVVYGAGRTNRTFRSTGSLDFVKESVERWVEEEGVSPDISIELIGDVLTAEKYTPEKKEKAGLECKEEPNAIDVLRSRIPKERELLVAKLALWRETRRPFSRLYTNAEGRLLGLFNFDVEQGWYEPHDWVEGSRQARGLVTPRKHKITAIDHVEGRDAIPGSYYPHMTVIDETNSYRGDHARFLNVTKAIKKTKH